MTVGIKRRLPAAQRAVATARRSGAAVRPLAGFWPGARWRCLGASAGQQRPVPLSAARQQLDRGDIAGPSATRPSRARATRILSPNVTGCQRCHGPLSAPAICLREPHAIARTLVVLSQRLRPHCLIYGMMRHGRRSLIYEQRPFSRHIFF